MATQDQIIRSISEQAPENIVQKVIENKQFPIKAVGLVKAGASKIPYLAPAFIANDFIKGASNAKQILGLNRDPDIKEGLAAAIGNVAHGLSWGAIPTNEASKILARKFTGGLYDKPAIQYDPSAAAAAMNIQKLLTEGLSK